MATLYERAAAKIKQEFAKYGVAITYTRPGAKTVNGPAGTSTPGAPTVYTGVHALSLDSSKGTPGAFANRREDGSLKKTQLRYLKIAAADLPIEPLSDDTLTFAEKTWLVLGCDPIDITGSDPLVYGVGVMAI